MSLHQYSVTVPGSVHRRLRIFFFYFQDCRVGIYQTQRGRKEEVNGPESAAAREAAGCRQKTRLYDSLPSQAQQSREHHHP